MELVEVQPANEAHVVRRVKAGRVKFLGDSHSQKVREGRVGGPKEYQLRLRDPARDLGKYVVVCGLVLKRSAREDQDRPFDIDIHRGKTRIDAWERQRLYAVAEVRQEYEPLGIVILRVRGLQAVGGHEVVECR